MGAAVVMDLFARLPAEVRAARRETIPQRKHPMDALRTDLSHTCRGLARRPGFVLLVAGTIALAVGINIAVFAVVDGVLVRALPYEGAGRLTMIFNRFPTLDVNRAAQNPRDFMDYREMTDAFEAIEGVGSYFPKTLTGRGDAERIDTIGISVGLLPMLGVEPLLGRQLTEDDDHTVVLISHGFWQARFAGSRDALGKTLVLNEVEHVVVGVLPAGFRLRLPGTTRVACRRPHLESVAAGLDGPAREVGRECALDQDGGTPAPRSVVRRCTGSAGCCC